MPEVVRDNSITATSMTWQKSIADAQKNGINYDAATWTGLCDWAKPLGVDVPTFKSLFYKY